MTSQPVGPSTLTRYFTTCFRVFGLWYGPSHSFWLHDIHCAFVCMFYFVYLLGLTTYFLFAESLEDYVNAMYMSLTILSLFVKIINFVAQNANINRSLDRVHSFVLNNDEERRLYKERHRTFARPMIYYYTVCYITALASAVNAAFQSALPFRGSYPCNWHMDRSCYWMVFSYQTVGIMLCVHLNVALEQFTCFMMFEISVQLQILGERLKQHGWKDSGDGQASAEWLRRWVRLHYEVVEYVINK